MPSGKRVLVLGAQGLLGTSLVPFLRRAGYEVFSHGRGPGADVQGDLTDEEAARSALAAKSPDVVVNLAALTDVDRCEREPRLAYLNNVRVVENVARWISDDGDRGYLVQISTDQVYDGPGPHTERDAAPVNYYGFSKFAGELAAGNVPSTIVRTNFFGPSNCASRTTLSDWVVQSLRARTPIVGFADVKFSPISISRLVELLELIISSPRTGIFNVGSREGMSKADFGVAVAEQFGLPTTLLSRGNSADAGLAAYRPKDMRMDSTRFERTFGVKLPTLSEEIKALKEA